MKRVLRWILVLPAAYAAGMIGLLAPVYLVAAFTPYASSFIDIFIGFIFSGFVFVAAGSIVAPAHRQPTAIILAMIAAALTGIDISAAMDIGEGAALLGLVLRLMGAGTAVFMLPTILDEPPIWSRAGPR